MYRFPPSCVMPLPLPLRFESTLAVKTFYNLQYKRRAWTSMSQDICARIRMQCEETEAILRGDQPALSMEHTRELHARMARAFTPQRDGPNEQTPSAEAGTSDLGIGDVAAPSALGVSSHNREGHVWQAHGMEQHVGQEEAASPKVKNEDDVEVQDIQIHQDASHKPTYAFVLLPSFNLKIENQCPTTPSSKLLYESQRGSPNFTQRCAIPCSRTNAQVTSPGVLQKYLNNIKEVIKSRHGPLPFSIFLIAHGGPGKVFIQGDNENMYWSGDVLDVLDLISRALPKGQLPYLRHVHIDACKTLKGISRADLARRVPHLKHVSLSGYMETIDVRESQVFLQKFLDGLSKQTRSIQPEAEAEAKVHTAHPRPSSPFVDEVKPTFTRIIEQVRAELADYYGAPKRRREEHPEAQTIASLLSILTVV